MTQKPNINQWPQVHEVGGVPVLLAPPDGEEVYGGIMFRVGMADEPVHLRGISHLIEHLAAHRVHEIHPHSNASTEAMFTTFYCAGSEQEVVRVLNEVCAGLRNLPLERLEHERGILQTEETSRGIGGDPLVYQRYGVTGHGRASLPEYGMDRITETDVRDWVSRYFTTQNAAVFLACDRLPEGLKPQLFDGERNGDPVGVARPVYLPAALIDRADGFLAHGVVERKPDATYAEHSAVCDLAHEVVRSTLWRRLRDELGHSYDVAVGTHMISSATTGFRVTADARPGVVGETVREALDSLDALVRDGVSEEAITEARSVLLEGLEAVTPAMCLRMQARTLLVADSTEYPPSASTIEAVTPEQVQDTIRAFRDSMLLVTDPTAIDLLSERGVFPFIEQGDEPVAGVLHKRYGTVRRGVIIGADGVTTVGGGERETARFASCPLLLRYPDGGRLLMQANGGFIALEPNILSGVSNNKLAKKVDENIPPERIIDLPERDKKEIPRFSVGGFLLFVLGALLLSPGIVMLIGAGFAVADGDWRLAIALAFACSPFLISAIWILSVRIRRWRRQGSIA